LENYKILDYFSLSRIGFLGVWGLSFIEIEEVDFAVETLFYREQDPT